MIDESFHSRIADLELTKDTLKFKEDQGVIAPEDTGLPTVSKNNKMSDEKKSASLLEYMRDLKDLHKKLVHNSTR